MYVHCKAATSSSGFLDYFNSSFVVPLQFLQLSQTNVCLIFSVLAGGLCTVRACCVLFLPWLPCFSYLRFLDFYVFSLASMSWFFSFLLLLQSQGASVQVVKCLVWNLTAPIELKGTKSNVKYAVWTLGVFSDMLWKTWMSDIRSLSQEICWEKMPTSTHYCSFQPSVHLLHKKQFSAYNTNTTISTRTWWWSCEWGRQLRDVCECVFVASQYVFKI